MKQLFLFLLLITILIKNSPAQSNAFTPKYSTIISKENGAHLLRQCSRPTPRKVKKYFDLTIEDIKILDSNFLKIATVDWLSNYGYQYVGLIIKKKRYIYINAFSIELINTIKDWQTNPIDICDGGNAYWGVLFDITTCTFSQYYTNGIARNENNKRNANLAFASVGVREKCETNGKLINFMDGLTRQDG